MGEKLIQFDQGLIASIQGFESPTLTLVMKFFTFIGSFSSVLLISLLAAIFLLCLKASDGAYIIWFCYNRNTHY